MGTNAIPTLLKWISYEPSPSEQASLTERTLPSAVGPDHTLSPAERAVRAHYAFCSLGAAARPAIPELARMVRTSADPKRAERCAYSLAGIGPEAIPSLLSLATNGPPLTRRCAIDALEPFARDPVATLIVPVLIRCLDDTNDPIVGAAQRVLINVNSAVVVPALTNALQSPSTRIRLRVVQCAFLLEAFIDPRQPSEAPTMVSALRAAMRDPDYEVRAAATNTLREVGGWQLVGEQWVRRHGTNTLYGITPDFFTNGPPR
jgi:HEAT repeat protein